MCGGAPGCGNLSNRLSPSLISTLEEAPELDEIVSYMKVRDFVVFDIVGGLERPLDHSLAQVDLVFVPRNHRFRSDLRWQQM